MTSPGRNTSSIPTAQRQEEPAHMHTCFLYWEDFHWRRATPEPEASAPYSSFLPKLKPASTAPNPGANCDNMLLIGEKTLFCDVWLLIETTVWAEGLGTVQVWQVGSSGLSGKIRKWARIWDIFWQFSNKYTNVSQRSQTMSLLEPKLFVYAHTRLTCTWH